MRFSPVLWSLSVVFLSLIGGVGGIASAHADGETAKDPATDPQVARLLAAKKTLNWNMVAAGTSDRYGHAETLVAAPADQLARRAVEFGKYKELHRKFAAARVINKEGDQTDVYMKYPVTIGPVTIELYEVMRFQPDHPAAGTHVIEGRGIKGDMKRGHTRITIKPVDATHSVLEVDILLVPVLPAPQSMVDEELRDGAYDFVNGLRDKSQPAAGPVVSL